MHSHSVFPLGSQLTNHSFHELLAHSALVVPSPKHAGAARRRTVYSANTHGIWDTHPATLGTPHTLRSTNQNSILALGHNTQRMATLGGEVRLRWSARTNTVHLACPKHKTVAAKLYSMRSCRAIVLHDERESALQSHCTNPNQPAASMLFGCQNMQRVH